MVPIELVHANLRVLNEAYFHRLDQRDFPRLAECFSPEATADYLNGRWKMTGRNQIIAKLRQIQHFPVSTHLMASCDFDSESAVSVTGRVLAVAHLCTSNLAGGDILVRGLEYVDKYSRDGDRWYIAHRRQKARWQYVQQGMDPVLDIA